MVQKYGDRVRLICRSRKGCRIKCASGCTPADEIVLRNLVIDPTVESRFVSMSNSLDVGSGMLECMDRSRICLSL